MKGFWLTLLLTGLFITPGGALEAADVVSSIRPLHALVNSLLDGTPVTREELLSPTASEHEASLSPKQHLTLKQARIIFAIHPDFEHFLRQAISKDRKIAKKLISTAEFHGLSILTQRQMNRSMTTADTPDYHLWLSQKNVELLARAIRDELVKVFSEHKQKININYNRLSKNFEKKSDILTSANKRLLNKKFIVFHDAFQYFEREHDIFSASIVSLNPETPLNMQHLALLSREIETQKVRCLFYEPQFEGKIVQQLAKKHALFHGVLDPLGSEIKPDIDFYPRLFTALKQQLELCAQH